jgi:general secretion pathway protein B
MSILLEALRKSEKNQHLRETPTIHTENQPVPVSEPLPIRWLVILLVVALLVIGWFIWRQYQQPAGADQSQITQEPVQAPAASSPAVSSTVVADKAPVQRVPSRTPDQAAPNPPPVSASTGQNRTPVESYQAPHSSDKTPGTAAATTAIDDSNVVIDSEAPTNGSRPTQKAANGLKEPATSAAASKQVETTTKEFRPGEPAPISYWELPDSVRADLPEIKFSVLVYAIKPDDRFVLMNGQRLGQGDTVQPGLVVKEIRRDGVVFNYRLYNFIVER